MPKIFGKRWGLRRSKRAAGGSKGPREGQVSAVELDLKPQIEVELEEDPDQELEDSEDDLEFGQSQEVPDHAPPAVEDVDQDLVALLSDNIELTIQRLSSVNFQPDPLAGPHFSKMVSLFSSAYKRHGNILEAAIRECVGRHDRYTVWTEPEFQVSQNAARFVTEVSLDTVNPLNEHFDYGDGPGRLQIDIMVWDDVEKTLRSYEVKRGHGRHDAGKIRSIKKEAYKTNVLLKSYGVQKGFEPRSVSSHVIFYYGNQSIPAPLGLSGSDLDGHFGIPVFEEVELVNKHFRRRLFEILADQ